MWAEEGKWDERPGRALPQRGYVRGTMCSFGFQICYQAPDSPQPCEPLGFKVQCVLQVDMQTETTPKQKKRKGLKMLLLDASAYVVRSRKERASR